jgi:glutamate N-acetyltransferase/amino-acid N-acetyltransferase
MAAIMTTDTRPKMAQVRMQHNARTLHVAGIAKGAGMIHPNMATMISVIMTDADMQSRELDGMLRRATDKSFHRITVDGDTSTNDSVFALASGEAGAFPAQLVKDAITAVARELALMVVKDGEGARKLIHVKVDEARNQREALQIAQTIASSLLVRTAVTGGDPNWGRILAAIGRSSIAIDIAKIRILANDVPLFENGAPSSSPLKDRQRAFAAESVMIQVQLGLGVGGDEFFTCDLTEGYVEVNSHYMT